MKRIFSVIVLSSLIVLLSSNTDVKKSYDWTQIKEFKFYGFNDPFDDKDAEFIFADTKKIKRIFSSLKSSAGYLPKGRSRFGVIVFNNNKKITLQFLAGAPHPFNVNLKGKYTDDWFDFDEKIQNEWVEYINELTEEIQSH